MTALGGELGLRVSLERIKQLFREENNHGGDAREVVLSIARLVGVDLTADPVNGDIWCRANMQRVVRAVQNALHPDWGE